ncbi:MAG: enoyl-CoA hydratase-related protein [Pseudomonadota bacterium]
MTSPLLNYQVSDALAIITLNQPEKRNAISAAMWSGIPALIEKANKDQTVEIIVIEGADGHFAAGADISEFESVYATTEKATEYTVTMLKALRVLERSAKPTIAKIRGACVGGGMSIALACDFRYADNSARLGITPSKLGLVYSADDTRRLVQTVGSGAAKRLLMTAEIISADAAEALGLVDIVVAADRLESEISGFAQAISGKSQWSVRATKRMFQHLAPGEDKAAMALMLEAFDGPDFQEGYKAFLAKRKPDFPFR